MRLPLFLSISVWLVEKSARKWENIRERQEKFLPVQLPWIWERSLRRLLSLGHQMRRAEVKAAVRTSIQAPAFWPARLSPPDHRFGEGTRALRAPLLFHPQSTLERSFGYSTVSITWVTFFFWCPSFPPRPLCDFLPCDGWRAIATELFSHSPHTSLIPLYPVAGPFHSGLHLFFFFSLPEPSCKVIGAS